MRWLVPGICILVAGSACVDAPARVAASSGAEADESDAQLLSRCEQDDFVACRRLRAAVWAQIPYEADWRKDHPVLLSYAEPAAAKLCRSNPAECPSLVDVVGEIRYPAMRLLGDAKVIADLDSICTHQQNPRVCSFLGGIYARADRVSEAVRLLVLGCRGVLQGDDAGCCEELVGLRDERALAGKRDAIDRISTALKVIRQARREVTTDEVLLVRASSNERTRELEAALDLLEAH